MTTTLDRIAERTRVRAARLVRWMEALWRDEATSADQGLSISPGEVCRRLLPRGEATAARADFYANDPVTGALAVPIAAADRALDDDAIWQRLITAFALSPLEADLLTTATALLVRPELGRVFAYLADDVAAVLPSLTLVADLHDRADPPGEYPGALVRWRLATPDAAAPIAATGGWSAASALLESLAKGQWHDPLLAEVAVALRPTDWSEGLPRLHRDVAERAQARMAGAMPVDLAGVAGSGRRTLAAQIAADNGVPLLLVDAARLAMSGDPAALLIATLRMARFEGAIAGFAHAGSIEPQIWHRVIRPDVPIIRCFEPGEGARHDAAVLTLGALSLAERLHVWRHLNDAEPPLAITASRVTVGEIARLAGRTTGVVADEPVPELLTRLPTPYGWDDLILPADTHAALTDFAAQVRLRGPVLEEWGFDRLSHLGAGLVALFAGPSGVGKTMAAQVLARDLGLELFRVDLAGVVDKYIGETEKRLRTAFAFAERPGVLLFFDEADALFGSRTQAKDSHDRYANLEINYLLQRIETFEGIAVLATNRKSELDPAFRRRLRAIVDFLPPGPPERLRLWCLSLPDLAPDGTPLAEGIDHATLADKLALTGADIKAAALGAAFLARAEDSTIRMRHVLAATQREMAKHGQAMRLPLAEVVAR